MTQRGQYAVEEPYRKSSAVTYDATLPVTDAIWVNAAGNVNVTMEDGTDRVFTLAASTGLNIAITKVKTASTTIAAASIIALYR